MSVPRTPLSSAPSAKSNVEKADMKHHQQRKRYVKDCEWLQQLHSVGLLRASFRPAAAMVPLRSYLRQRAILVEELTRRWHFQGISSSAESGVCPNSSRNLFEAFFLRLRIL